MRTILMKAGFSVDAAANGAEALQLASTHDYDLVFMDVYMPVLDGMTVAHKIRAFEAPRCEVPIIAMTVESEPSRVTTLLEAGMSTHITKPFRNRELIDLVECVLGRFKERRKNSATLPSRITADRYLNNSTQRS